MEPPVDFIVMCRTNNGATNMITPKDGEPRLHYLARVLYKMMHETGAGEYTMEYDETTCDGLCLANDFLSELGMDERDAEGEDYQNDVQA